MPLYDCMLLLKPHVDKAAVLDLVARVGAHVYRRNGVLTDFKSFGKIYLGYGIKKLDGRYYQLIRRIALRLATVYQGQLTQMTMMVTPNFNKELHYLNKEDRLLRWLLVKHRDTQTGRQLVPDNDEMGELRKFSGGGLYGAKDDDDDEDDDEEEYEVEENKE